MQAIVDHRLGGSCLRQELYDRFFGSVDVVAIEDAGIHQRSRLALSECLGQRRIRIVAFAADDPHDRQIELPGKIEVALIVAGHAHDGARSVFHQHVIGNPDWDFFLRRRICCVGAGEDTGLIDARLPRDQILLRRPFAIGLNLFLFLRRRQRLDQRVLGSEHHVSRAEDRVRTCGEDANLALLAGDFLCLELQLGAFRPANPVPLRGLRSLRPIDVIEILEQPRRVVADAEEPLLEQTLLYLGSTALAETAGHDLLVHELQVADGDGSPNPLERRARMGVGRLLDYVRL